MNRPIPCALVLALLPAFAGAEGWIDNPGFCNADSAEQELADVVYLDRNGIEAHWMRCAFKSRQDLTRPRSKRVRAQCEDGARTFATTFDMTVNRQGRVALFANENVGLPEFYFPCDRWGYRDN